MKHAEQEITLYSFSEDRETGYETGRRLFLSGVSVFNQTKTNVEKDRLSAANLITIRIPEEIVFQPFPLKTGDVIVLGNVPEENPSRGQLLKQYGGDRVVTVTGVTDNRGGRQPHWKVVGK